MEWNSHDCAAPLVTPMNERSNHSEIITVACVILEFVRGQFSFLFFSAAVANHWYYQRWLYGVHRLTWAGRLIVVAAVQCGHAGLVAVAGAIGVVRLPSFADAGHVAAAAAQTRFLAAWVTRSGQEEHRQGQINQREGISNAAAAAAALQGHPEGRSQFTLPRWGVRGVGVSWSPVNKLDRIRSEADDWVPWKSFMCPPSLS